jgi:hypothetical protein
MNPLISHATFHLYIIAGLLGLAIALVLMALGCCVYMARLWIRFERVCGGYRQAMNVLKEAEMQFGTDSMIRRGMKYARRMKWI